MAGSRRCNLGNLFSFLLCVIIGLTTRTGVVMTLVFRRYLISLQLKCTLCHTPVTFIRDSYTKQKTLDWSILYVVIALFTCFVFVVGCVWGTACICSRLCICCHRPSKRQRYALIESNEDPRLPLGKVMLSESESDSDILFESRKSSKHLLNGDSRNGVKSNRNNFKMERRVKS